VSAAEISQRLDLRPKTVRNYVSNALQAAGRRPEAGDGAHATRRDGVARRCSCLAGGGLFGVAGQCAGATTIRRATVQYDIATDGFFRIAQRSYLDGFLIRARRDRRDGQRGGVTPRGGRAVCGASLVRL
jgi:hypothetical protein